VRVRKTALWDAATMTVVGNIPDNAERLSV
jgi:hypothetical protein